MPNFGSVLRRAECLNVEKNVISFFFYYACFMCPKKSLARWSFRLHVIEAYEAKLLHLGSSSFVTDR